MFSYVGPGWSMETKAQSLRSKRAQRGAITADEFTAALSVHVHSRPHADTHKTLCLWRAHVHAHGVAACRDPVAVCGSESRRAGM